MPKDTFLNLPKEKKMRIEAVALDEFSSLGYDNASINNIVSASGIAKGSFYQYFEDKKDLFSHLVLNVLAAKKIEYLAPVMNNPHEHEFFTLIKEMYISGLKFATENPRHEKISTWIAHNLNHPVVQELYNTPSDMAADFFYNLVVLAQDRGEIRKDFDAAYISYLIPRLATTTIEYYFKMQEKAEIDNVVSLTDGIMVAVDMMIDSLKNGIGTKN